jgi:hypothetical protein
MTKRFSELEEGARFTKPGVDGVAFIKWSETTAKRPGRAPFVVKEDFAVIVEAE